MQATRAIVLGITAAIVIGCGVVMGVLLHQLTVTVLDGATDVTVGEDKYSSIKNVDAGPVWTLGLVYVIPGLLAFIAALVQNKCLYITSCVISMIAIALMGLVIVVGGMPVFFVLLVFFKLSQDCESVGDVCRCRIDDQLQQKYERTPFKTCDFMTDFTYIGIGIGVVVVVAWLFLIAAFIIACIYACKTKRREGTVYTPQQQPMLKGEAQPM